MSTVVSIERLGVSFDEHGGHAGGFLHPVGRHQIDVSPVVQSVVAPDRPGEQGLAREKTTGIA